MEMPTNSPVLLLKLRDESVHIPIWIGAPEAAAIAQMVEEIEPPRPLTHDLVLDVAAASGRALSKVEVTALREDIFHAQLIFDDGGRVDARASDAVALAVRAQVPVLIADEVVAAAGEVIVEEEEDEVAAFREFLDHVNPDDFEEPGDSPSSSTEA